MRRPGHLWIVVALILTSISGSHAQAGILDWLALYRTQINAIARFDGAYRRTAGTDGTIDTEWRAGVRIRQRGFIMDPGIASFDLGFEPLYSWGKFDLSNNPQTRSGRVLSYNLNLNLLRGTPGPFAYQLSAVRSTNINSGSLGGRYDTEIENKTAGMFWKSLAFPMSLVYLERDFKQEFVSGTTNFITQRDETVRTLTLKGNSSKLRLFGEYLEMDDHVPGRNLDYHQYRFDAGHSLPWGSGSSLESSLGYLNRGGFNNNQLFSIIESANIQHGGNLSSTTSFRLAWINASYDSSTYTGQFRLFHDLYGNLRTNANLWATRSTSEPQDYTQWRTGIDTQYTKQDLFGAVVHTGVGLSYSVLDRESKQGLIEVIDESHVVTLGGAVILNNRFIIIPTIIVTNADSSLVYADGVDYTIIDLPEDLTQLQVIPGGRIEIGETILVSYKRESAPSGEIGTTYTRFSTGFNLGWMRFGYYFSNKSDSLLSGMGESFLNPSRNNRADLEFRWKTANVNYLVGAEWRHDRFDEFETTIYTFRQLLTWDAFETTQWDLNLAQSFTESSKLSTDLYNLNLSVSWQALMNLTIRGHLGAWARFDEGDILVSGKRDDKFVTAGFTLRWFYRKVNFDLAYNHHYRTNDTHQPNVDIRQTNEDRLMLNLNRRF